MRDICDKQNVGQLCNVQNKKEVHVTSMMSSCNFLKAIILLKQYLTSSL